MSARHSVLVPVDGSANSLRALAIACQRTRGRRGATVVALNVQPAMPPSRFSPREAIRDHHERMAAEVFQKVAVVAKREKIRVQQEMVVGTLQCQNPGGSRAYESQYAAFVAKFQIG